jgi:purine-binding chemotaxis protein CheW
MDMTHSERHGVSPAGIARGSAPRPGASEETADRSLDSGEEPQTFLTFSLGGQYFALSVDPVREILDEQPVATLPEAPADVVGLIDVRGEGVIVVDISHRLGVVAAAHSNRRIVVLERPGADGRPVGVFADQVLSVVEIGVEGIEPPPRTGPENTTLLCGVARLGGQLVMVLDHRRLLWAQTDDIFDFAS